MTQTLFSAPTSLSVLVKRIRFCSRRTPSRRLSTRRNSSFLRISEEVAEAVKASKPVVALETTIYTHGFPYPDNVALASHLESVVRSNGGVPATIGVLDGVARVGMSAEEIIELLEKAGKADTIKLSRRDLGYICGQGLSGKKLNGGTTIAGTMVLAHLAGIKVFATGGLGGVHKGGEDSLDISADLTELGRTPVALVSSGCKSFLDIPRTLEYLETQGVGVATFADGRTGNIDFPAFWTRDSGVRSPMVVRNEKEAAAIAYAQMNLPLSSALLFANPIAEEHSLSRSYMDQVMAQAVHDAAEKGFTGRDNTPFVLSRIRELTKGATVSANRALVQANVARGTKVAVELAKLELRYDGVLNTDQHPKAPITQTKVATTKSKAIEILVAGSIAIDHTCDYEPVPSNGPGLSSPALHTSNPAVIAQSIGGVGNNVATAIHFLGGEVRLCGAVGDDLAGQTAVRALQSKGMHISEIRIVEGGRTAQYVAVNDTKKDLVVAMADMRILEGSGEGFDTTWQPRLRRCKPKWLVLDANWDPSTLTKWIRAGKAMGAKLAYEPVSLTKSKRLFMDNTTYPVDLAAPNRLELEAMGEAARIQHRTAFESLSVLHGLPGVGTTTLPTALGLLPYIYCILTKLGPDGVLLTKLLQTGDPLLDSPSSSQYRMMLNSRPESELSRSLLNIMDEASVRLKSNTLDSQRSRQDRASMGFEDIYVRHFPPVEQVPSDQVVSVNGCGDTFLGVIIAGLARGPRKSLEELIGTAQKGAVMTLKSKESVSPEISRLKAELD